MNQRAFALIVLELLLAIGFTQYLMQCLSIGTEHESAMIPDWSNVTYAPYPVDSQGILDPVMTASKVTDRPLDNSSRVADPFIFFEDDTFYMFFEVVSAVGEDIGLAASSDGFNWTYQKIVLDEPFHLAYPLVFRWNGRYYMTPDSFEKDSVRLYEAADFPHNWTCVATIVSGKAFVDPTIFRYSGLWWMFVGDTTNANCYLYYSSNLTDPGSWIEHPKSPITSGDTSKARPGGRSGIFGERILRFSQKSDVSYGEAVRVFEVDTLNTTHYAEHEIPISPVLQKTGGGWNKDGMHSIDPWWIGNRWIVAVDGVDRTVDPVHGNWSIGIYVTRKFPPRLDMHPIRWICHKYNETFKIRIDISDVQNVRGFGFQVHYNTTLLDYADAIWDAWGSGTIGVTDADGKLAVHSSGPPRSGNFTLVTIFFNATYHRIWKKESTVPCWKNNQTGIIYIQSANLSYPDALSIRYERGALNEIIVGPDVIYSFSPKQGDLDNDGHVGILDLTIVATYFSVKESDHLWLAASEYDLNGDKVINIADIAIVARAYFT